MKKSDYTVKIYHNKKCKISRNGLQALQTKNINFEIVDYLKQPLTIKEMEMLLMKLHIKPIELIRTNEAIYKTKFKGQQFNDDEWIKIMLEYPNLIQRPIVETQYKAFIARPVELIDELIQN